MPTNAQQASLPLTEAASASGYDHFWRVRKFLPERHGQRCRVLARGRLSQVMVEFPDGERYVTIKWFARPVKEVPDAT